MVVAAAQPAGGIGDAQRGEYGLHDVGGRERREGEHLGSHHHEEGGQGGQGLARVAPQDAVEGNDEEEIHEGRDGLGGLGSQQVDVGVAQLHEGGIGYAAARPVYRGVVVGVEEAHAHVGVVVGGHEAQGVEGGEAVAVAGREEDALREIHIFAVADDEEQQHPHQVGLSPVVEHGRGEAQAVDAAVTPHDKQQQGEKEESAQQHRGGREGDVQQIEQSHDDGLQGHSQGERKADAFGPRKPRADERSQQNAVEAGKYDSECEHGITVWGEREVRCEAPSWVPRSRDIRSLCR